MDSGMASTWRQAESGGDEGEGTRRRPLLRNTSGSEDDGETASLADYLQQIVEETAGVRRGKKGANDEIPRID